MFRNLLLKKEFETAYWELDPVFQEKVDIHLNYLSNESDIPLREIPFCKTHDGLLEFRIDSQDYWISLLGFTDKEGNLILHLVLERMSIHENLSNGLLIKSQIFRQQFLNA